MPCATSTGAPLFGCCGGPPQLVDESVQIYGWPKPCVRTTNPFNCLGDYREDTGLEAKVLQCVAQAYQVMLDTPWPGIGTNTIIRLATDPFSTAALPNCLPVTPCWGFGRTAIAGWARGNGCSASYAGFAPPYIFAQKWRVHSTTSARICTTRTLASCAPFTGGRTDVLQDVTIGAATSVLELMPLSTGIICPMSSLNNLAITGSFNITGGGYEFETALGTVCVFP